VGRGARSGDRESGMSLEATHSPRDQGSAGVAEGTAAGNK
jgi:hypothetical protein